tara:strand:- start:728 stop:2722 length:1995 start_codon:yes stop_codon:yes gene_type:complete
MATEILNLEVKTNIKGAVTEVDKLSGAVKTTAVNYEELNDQVAAQNEYIAAQETELVRLKTIQDSIPKGAWFAGQSKLSEDIKEVTSEIRSEKDALKNLKAEQKDVAKTIRDKTAAQKKDTNAAIRGIQHFQIMGVSIRKLKYMVRGVIPMFKLLFTTIKSGIISTGIGAIVLALIAIGTSMKSSVAGGKAFKAMMEGIGVVTGAVTDAISFLGDAMLSVFGFDSSTDAAVVAAENLEQAYKDLGREMDKLTLKKAQNGREELKNKQIINDTTKSEKERTDAALANYKLISKNNADRLNNLKLVKKADEEAIELNRKTIAQLESERSTRHGMSDEEKEAKEKGGELDKKILDTRTALAGVRLKMDQDRIAGINTINTIRKTQIEKDKQAAKDKKDRDDKGLADTLKRIEEEKKAIQDLIDLETDRANNQIINRNKLLDDFGVRNLEQIQKEKNATIDKWNAAIQAEKEGSAQRIELEEALQAELAEIDAKYKKIKEAAETATGITSKAKAKRLAEQKAAMERDFAHQGLQIIGDAAGEGTALAKAAAIAQTTISGVQGVQNAFTAANANIGAAAGSFGAYPVTMAALAAAFAAANIAKIASGSPPTAGDMPPAPSITPPAPQMMSGAFELTGGQDTQPLQAYVVSDDITNSQNGLAVIRRRATI